jgi:hypothetical protein
LEIDGSSSLITHSHLWQTQKPTGSLIGKEREREREVSESKRSELMIDASAKWKSKGQTSLREIYFLCVQREEHKRLRKHTHTHRVVLMLAEKSLCGEKFRKAPKASVNLKGRRLLRVLCLYLCSLFSLCECGTYLRISKCNFIKCSCKINLPCLCIFIKRD